jgi:hypothetical protein
MDSIELSKTALFSVILIVTEFISFNFTWPVLPPIVVVPFITSFVLAMALPFIKTQWIIGLIASLVIMIQKGGILPGPLIIPIYGFIFQTRKVKLSGAISSIIHVLYGVFLAPLIFSVAPATIVYKWLLVYLGSFAPAIVIAAVVFGVGGALAARSGYKIGLKIAKNLQEGRCHDS